MARETKRPYPPFAVTVDLVLLTLIRDRLCVLAVKRAAEPFIGRWALPGGFVQPDENLEQAARRELREETGLDAARIHLEQLATYGNPHRDPRQRVVSVAYLWRQAYPRRLPEATRRGRTGSKSPSCFGLGHLSLSIMPRSSRMASTVPDPNSNTPRLRLPSVRVSAPSRTYAGSTRSCGAWI